MEEPPPPPPPRLRAPPSLPDELVEEILLRTPPDHPARLVRTALVCKRWSRLISDLAFRRRFRGFHLQRGGAPMLGFLHNKLGRNSAVSVRFVRTSASCPPLDTKRGWLALDARGGRVLLHRSDGHPGRILFYGENAASPEIRLAVWNPLAAAGYLELSVLILPTRRPRCWNAALLCCNQHGLQDHADVPFRVVLVTTDSIGIFVYVYSSRPASWGEPAYTAQHPGHPMVDAVFGALVGDTLYFLLHWRTRILEYNLATGDISVIQLPPTSHSRRMMSTVLMTTENGGLGFARVEGNKLCLWSMEATPNCGALAMEWTERRVIDLGSLLPLTELLGFVDGLGIILVWTIKGIFSVDQKSGRIDKFRDVTEFYTGIVPFVSFYTPALGMASTYEGASVNACVRLQGPCPHSPRQSATREAISPTRELPGQSGALELVQVHLNPPNPVAPH